MKWYVPMYRDGRCIVKARPGEPQAGRKKRKKRQNHRMRKALVRVRQSSR